MKQVLDEIVDVRHKRWRPRQYELVDARDRVRPNLRVTVLEEGQELGHQHVQRSVQTVRVQVVGGVFADLQQSAERSLARVIVLGVQQQAESGQQLGPVVQVALGGDRGDDDADRGPDQRGRIADRVEAFLLDELGYVWRKRLKVCANIVLQEQTAQGSRCLVCGGVDGRRGGVRNGMNGLIGAHHDRSTVKAFTKSITNRRIINDHQKEYRPSLVSLVKTKMR